MRAEFARLIWLQGVAVIIGAALTYAFADLSAVKSIVYGNMVSLIGALLMALRYRQGKRQTEAEWVLRHAYKTAIERFIWTIFLLLIGFKLLDLSPLWLLAGFVMGQAVWLLAPIWMKLRTQNDK
jgi:F0F1-type ATP synthase assembly protein I